MKTLKEYIRALNHGKEIERLTIINWLEEVEQIDAFGDTDVAGIINALRKRYINEGIRNELRTLRYRDRQQDNREKERKGNLRPALFGL